MTENISSFPLQASFMNQAQHNSKMTDTVSSGGFRGGSLGSDEPPLFLILNCKLQGINLIYHA